MMTDRNVWVKAGTILAEHGKQTADYIIDQITSALGDRVEDGCRVAAAFDSIKAASPQ